MTRPVTHPAQYSPEVLRLMRFIVPRLARIHDPFAGPGTRLGHAADDRPWYFTGTEIEQAFIVDHRVHHGDSTDPDTYPWPLACGECGETEPTPEWPCRSHVLRPYTIVTSPVYPNGMADDFVSRAADASTRRTYRHALAETTGRRDVSLTPNNMGRWGYRSGGLDSTNRLMYWHLARKAVACWGDAERVIVNVSDFLAGKRQVPVVDPWAELLTANGWEIEAIHDVHTRRFRNGANGSARAEAEAVIVAVRPANAP